MPWELPAIMDKELAVEGLRRLGPLKHIQSAMHPDPMTPYSRIATLESCLYMRNQLLRDADWAGMAHGLEIRVPLVDYQLLSVMASVLTSQHPTEYKSILGQTPQNTLPLNVLNRKKTGFLVPSEQWIEIANVFHTWKEVEILKRSNCHWARRWAHVVSSKLYEDCAGILN